MKKLLKLFLLFSVTLPVYVACSKENPSGGGSGKAPASAVAVDLGLSVKWASCNVGASSQLEYGDYFAWGETSPKTEYNYNSYKWNVGPTMFMTKYCADDECGYNGFKDNNVTLDPEDDAAVVNWGGGWRTPTAAEWEELMEDCVWELGTLDGVYGARVSGKKSGYTDKWIFIPAAGVWHPSDGTTKPQTVDYREATNMMAPGASGYYWSSSLREDYAVTAQHLNFFYFNKAYVTLPANDRVFGMPVRPVCK